MKNVENIDELLKDSAQRALYNQTPKLLISASIEDRRFGWLKFFGRKEKWKTKWFRFSGRKQNWEIQWLCIYDYTATEEDFEFGAIAGTEIISDFSSEYGINEMFEIIELNIKPRVLKNTVYSRI